MSDIVQVCWLRPEWSEIPFAEIVERGLGDSWETHDIAEAFDDDGRCRYTASPRRASTVGTLDTALPAIEASDYRSLWLKRDELEFHSKKNPFEDRLAGFDVLCVSAPR